MDIEPVQSLKMSLETIHKITQGLNIPLKPRFISLILYANTFERLQSLRFQELSSACISLACKLEEACHRMDKILDYFNTYFRGKKIRRECVARAEVEVAKSIGFEFDICPVASIYLSLLKTCEAAGVNHARVRMIELIHLDARILRLRYLEAGDLNPGDVALALVDDKQIRKMAERFNLFVDFCALDTIRESMFGDW